MGCWGSGKPGNHSRIHRKESTMSKKLTLVGLAITAMCAFGALGGRGPGGQLDSRDRKPDRQKL